MSAHLTLLQFNNSLADGVSKLSVPWTAVTLAAATQGAVLLTIRGVYLMESDVDIYLCDSALEATALAFNMATSGHVLPWGWRTRVLQITNGWLGYLTRDGGVGELRYKKVGYLP